MRPNELSQLFASAEALKGIGPRLADLLKKAVQLPPGVAAPRVLDLLWHLPTGVIDRRAEPTVAAYERGEIHHVGIFGKLESQLCMMTANGFQDKGSPDRMDALVWADAELSGAIAQPVLPVSSTRAAPLAGV